MQANSYFQAEAKSCLFGTWEHLHLLTELICHVTGTYLGLQNMRSPRKAQNEAQTPIQMYTKENKSPEKMCSD